MKKESNKTKAKMHRDKQKNMLTYIVKVYIYTRMTHNVNFLSNKTSKDKSYLSHIVHLSNNLEYVQNKFKSVFEEKAANILWLFAEKPKAKWSLAAWTCLIMRVRRRERIRRS